MACFLVIQLIFFAKKLVNQWSAFNGSCSYSPRVGSKDVKRLRPYFREGKFNLNNANSVSEAPKNSQDELGNGDRW